MLVSLAIVATLVLSTTDRPSDPHAVVRGMTISCHSWGWEWGTDEMVETMRTLRDLGVNWVAIHPYAGIRADGTVAVREGWYRDAEWIRRPIREAHRLGLKIMIKPHLAYWGSPFSWRGAIRFETPEQWERFFETYRPWVEQVAAVAEDADAFCIGTELDATVGHELAWRDVIAAVRRRTDVPLTYSANWDQYERVPFWDALDVVGIQSYFPLVGHDGEPSEAELEAGWDRLLRRLEAFSTRVGKKIVLAELGYNRSAKAAREPWDYRTGGPAAERIQQRCMVAALRALRRSDAVVGAFLWKWFPGESRRGNFLMSEPAVRAVIEQEWKGPRGLGR